MAIDREMRLVRGQGSRGLNQRLINLGPEPRTPAAHRLAPKSSLRIYIIHFCFEHKKKEEENHTRSETFPLLNKGLFS